MPSCFGVIYVHLVNSGYTNTQLAAIPAVFLGLTNLLGPLSTGLYQYYSARRLTIIGVVIASSGILLCAFCDNLFWLYFCLGGLAGFGNALVKPQGFLIGQQYFRRNRVTANGLSMLGGSIGFMTLPPLLNYLIETYSAEGTFMLWSAIILHALIGAALFHPVEWHMKPKRTAVLESIKVQQNGNQSQVKSDIPSNKIVVAGKLDDKKDFCVYEDDTVVKHLTPDKDESDESDPEDMYNSNDLALCSSDMKNGFAESASLCSDRQWKNPLTDTLQTNEYLERPRTVSIERSMEILPKIPEESEDEDCFEPYDQQVGNERIEFLNRENEIRNRPVSFINTKSVDSFMTAPSSESIFDSNDVIDEFGSALSVKTEKLKDRLQCETDKIQKSNVSKSNNFGKKALKPHVFCGIKFPRFRDIINFSVLRHPAFLVNALSSVFNRLVYTCFITYIPSIGYEIGVAEQAPYLLSIIAIFELLAKVVMSFISDRGWLERRYYMIIGAVNASLSTLTLTFAWDFITLGTCCGWYGFSVGTCMSVGPVLLVEYLGIKLLPYSFGLLLFMNGIFGLFFFPLTGWLNDAASSYLTTYYTAGCLAAFPAFLWMIVPCFAKPVDDDSKSPTNNV
ncbi:monocarboxylate transporter 9-like isoform X2 [Panulirus ornatus]